MAKKGKIKDVNHFEIGENIEGKIVKGVLHLEIDLDEDLGPSKSGKSIGIASTKGNKLIPGTEAVLGLNCYRKAK